MVLTVYRCLLWLYPKSYREEFAEEMSSVFCESRSNLPPALAAKINFYQREFRGLLSGAVRANFNVTFGIGIPFRRFDMQTQFRFPSSAVFLMVVIFGGVVLAIVEANGIARGASGLAWRSLVSGFSFMLLSACAIAAASWGILHARHRSGVHRLQNIQR